MTKMCEIKEIKIVRIGRFRQKWKETENIWKRRVYSKKKNGKDGWPMCNGYNKFQHWHLRINKETIKFAYVKNYHKLFHLSHLSCIWWKFWKFYKTFVVINTMQISWVANTAINISIVFMLNVVVLKIVNYFDMVIIYVDQRQHRASANIQTC